MHYDIYDPTTGELLGSLQQLDFGDMIQNQYCLNPLVIRAIPDQETNISNLVMYLENKGSWKDSIFEYYINPTFISSVQPGSNLFTPFIEVPNAVSGSPNGVPIGWDTTASDYVWLGTQIHNVTGFSQANFRLFYDLN
jgi:hypothetical protein